MVVLLTQEQLLQKLSNLQEATIPAVKKGMKDACLNIEGKAKENCTPGKSPYRRAPYSDDGDPNAVPPHMRDVMYSKVEVSGNQIRGTIGNPKDYAAAVHEGTTRASSLGGRTDVMYARPFIMDAIKEKTDETGTILSEALLDELKKVAV